MLSRVADNLYWMARQIERAENIARLLEVNLQLLLDFKDLNDRKVKEHWDPIIRATGDEEQFYKIYELADSQTVTDFLVFDTKNKNSVLSCIFSARENARMVRDQIPSEIFESLNQTYLFLKSKNAKQVWLDGAWSFFRRIKEYSHLFQGLLLSATPRDEGYEFMRFGTQLERAEKTTRILDMKYHMLLPSAMDVGGAIDIAQWVALLKSVSAYEAYHRLFVADVKPDQVAQFLIFSDTFPRSIRYCLQSINNSLHRISGCPLENYSNEAERLSGLTLSELNYSSVDYVFGQGLHEYLESMQERLENIAESAFKSYMFLAPVNMEREIQQQVQQ